MTGGLGREYEDGETVVRQGEPGTSMFVVQEGRCEVVRQVGARQERIGELAVGDVFGEMAIFEGETRSATVRAVGPARILTVDRRAFLRRVQEDPSLALDVLRALSQRVRRLGREVAELRGRSTPEGGSGPSAGGRPAPGGGR
jgi:CRP/FNR family transcriptional regulator